MSTESAESVAAKMQALNDALKAHGVAEDIGIFMTLAFVSLPVIPKLRLNTYCLLYTSWCVNGYMIQAIRRTKK